MDRLVRLKNILYTLYPRGGFSYVLHENMYGGEEQWITLSAPFAHEMYEKIKDEFTCGIYQDSWGDLKIVLKL